MRVYLPVCCAFGSVCFSVSLSVFVCVSILSLSLSLSLSEKSIYHSEDSCTVFESEPSTCEKEEAWMTAMERIDPNGFISKYIYMFIIITFLEN